ncbi:MAG: hypothetical protein C5S48_08295 [Candidatus Methanogaster sp.]|nr:MAG: hypothetical protein C5S48_08295 [ANME-2 cluster archaeon]
MLPILVIDRLIGSLQRGGISITTVHAWEDMLYKICTYNVFRGDLPIDDTRDYIDLMQMGVAGVHAKNILPAVRIAR